LFHHESWQNDICSFRAMTVALTVSFKLIIFKTFISITAGRSGLAITCLTAVREIPGSNRAVGSCAYRKSHCNLQPWAVCTLPAVPRSTQPSTLRGMVNEYQLSG